MPPLARAKLVVGAMKCIAYDGVEMKQNIYADSEISMMKSRQMRRADTRLAREK